MKSNWIARFSANEGKIYSYCQVHLLHWNMKKLLSLAQSYLMGWKLQNAGGSYKISYVYANIVSCY